VETREGCIYVAEAGRGCPAKMCSHSKYAVDKADRPPERHCHLNRNLQANEHGRNDFTLRPSRGAMSA